MSLSSSPLSSTDEAEATCSEEKEEIIIFIQKSRQIPQELPMFDSSICATKRHFWREKLLKHGIRNVLAPMVDQSELAFRMFCRKYSAQLCYTPMIHAHLFVTDPTYRRISFTTFKGDRPLIVQFCANNPQMLLNACRLVEGNCDGVDLNLGCPQMIAKKGYYGAYLQENPELIEQMVSLVNKHCKLPLSVKIRILQDLPSTIEYAKMLERSGACMITIHGRTREQKGVNTGLANWDVIKALKRELSIPVLANGNIQMPGDVERCIAQTGVDGVMSAEGLLSNPCLFHGKNPFSFDVALEYLDFAQRFDASNGAVRAHIFRICHYCFLKYEDLRERNAICCSLQEFRENLLELRRRCLAEMETDGISYDEHGWAKAVERHMHDDKEIPLPELVQKTPHYFCKPYIRPSKELDDQNGTNGSSSAFRQQRRAELERLATEAGLSKRQVRKRAKRRLSKQKELNRKQTYPKCDHCQQPAGINCDNQMCRRCCKFVCVRGIQPRCKTHNFDHEALRLRGGKWKEQNEVAMDTHQSVCPEPDDEEDIATIEGECEP